MNNKRRVNKKIKKEKYIVVLIVAIIIAVMIFIFCKSQNNNDKKKVSVDELKGTWTTDGVTVYEFDGTGNGKLKVPTSEYKFSYILHNNEIYIDFESENAKDSDYEYKFEDEDLVFTGIKATSGTYTFHKK